MWVCRDVDRAVVGAGFVSVERAGFSVDETEATGCGSSRRGWPPEGVDIRGALKPLRLRRITRRSPNPTQWVDDPSSGLRDPALHPPRCSRG